MVQGLRLCSFTAGRVCLIPGGGAKILHAVRCIQKFKINEYIIRSTGTVDYPDAKIRPLPQSLAKINFRWIKYEKQAF